MRRRSGSRYAGFFLFAGALVGCAAFWILRDRSDAIGFDDSDLPNQQPYVTVQEVDVDSAVLRARSTVTEGRPSADSGDGDVVTPSTLTVLYSTASEGAEKSPWVPHTVKPKAWRDNEYWGSEQILTSVSTYVWQATVAPGQYVVHPGPGWGGKVGVSVAPGVSKTVTVNFSPPAAAVVVRCLLPDLTPAPNALVVPVWSDVAHLDWRSAAAKDGGLATLLQKQGSVVAMHPRWSPSEPALIPTTEDPSPDDIVLVLNEAQPGWLEIPGSTQYRIALSPVRHGDGPATDEVSPLEFLGTIDSANRRIAGLPVGEYKWFAHSSDQPTGSLAKGLLTIHPGVGTTLKPELLKTGGLEVLVGPQDLVSRDLTVKVYSEEWPWMKSLKNLEGGRFSCTGAPPGKVTVICEDRDLYGTAHWSVVASENTTCQIRLSPRPSIRGRVISTWELPSDASVWAARPGSGSSVYLRKATIGSEGEFVIVGLDQGTLVDLKVVAPSLDYGPIGELPGVVSPSAGNEIYARDPSQVGGKIALAAQVLGGESPEQADVLVVSDRDLDNSFAISLNGEEQVVGPIPPGVVRLKYVGEGLVSETIKDVKVVAGTITRVPKINLQVGGRLGFDFSNYATTERPRSASLRLNSQALPSMWLRFEQGERWTEWIEPGDWTVKFSFSEAPNREMQVAVQAETEHVIEVPVWK